LAMVCILAFFLGTWYNLDLIKNKSSLLEKIKAGQDAVEANEALTSEFLADYETLRPFFAAQQNTLDTLKTLALLQQSRSNRSCWYVLIADQQSYFTQPLPILSTTNKTSSTNVVAASTAPLTLNNIFSGSWVMWTNISLAKPGIIAELCIPEEAEAARRSLGQIVNELQHHRLFSIADLLPEDQRRALADPKVAIPDREFVLRLDFNETDFQKSGSSKRGPSGVPSRSPRRVRSPSSTSENAVNFSQGK